VRYPLSLRQVEDLLLERGIDTCHETVRGWWSRLGPKRAVEIGKRPCPIRRATPCRCPGRTLRTGGLKIGRCGTFAEQGAGD